MDRKSNLALFLFFLICSAILLPLLFPSVGCAKNVTLGWDANPEPDLEGYVVYRNIGSPGPPYAYADELPEDTLIDPLNPRVTITGLRKDTRYYVAVTAYDTRGNESNFSDAVCVKIVGAGIENCSSISSTSSNPSSSSGGKDGSSCFIATAAGDFTYASVIWCALIVAGVILGAAGRRQKDNPECP